MMEVMETSEELDDAKSQAEAAPELLQGFFFSKAS